MNILLTGSSGFFGEIIYSELLKIEKNILKLSRTKGDLKIDLSIEKPKFKDKIDFVIHASGKAHSIARTKLDVKDFFEINVTGTKNLLSGLELGSVPKYFVFISSVAVYGKEFGLNIDEQTPLNAQDPYGMSKIQTEQLVIDWCYKNNVVCTILRLPLLVGKNPPGNLGEMLKAIKKGYYFNIGGGKANKSMVLAEDVAHFIPKIAVKGGTFNLTDGKHPSFSALSVAIARKKIFNLPIIIAKLIGFIGDILGKRAPVNSIKIKKITSDLTFDDSKARQFGWNPQSVLEYLKHNDL
jgi:nucleoside-diphosphate-sugar epimerase